MSSTKFNPTRALKVIPSDNCNVPYPTALASGTSTNTSTNELIDTNIVFFVDPEIGGRQYVVNVGDVVYNISTQTAATIVEVIKQDTLLLNADIIVSGDNYIIYQEGPTTGQGNQGCILYLGGTQNLGEIHVTTIGGDDMVVSKVTKPFFPIQVKKVWLTGTESLEYSDIYALW
jgi:hypothetical protein